MVVFFLKMDHIDNEWLIEYYFVVKDVLTKILFTLKLNNQYMKHNVKQYYMLGTGWTMWEWERWYHIKS